MFFLVPTIATLLLCGGGLWEGERGLTFHSKVVSVFITDCNTEQTSLSRLFAVLLLLTVNWCLLKQQHLGTVNIIKVTRTV